jgi:nitrogen fixation NifU-like protein
MSRIEYSKKVLEHFTNPRNVGVIEDADGTGSVGNPVCGDMMEITLKVVNDRVEDIKFRTFGCASAIATTSMLTEIVKGKTLQEAENIGWDDVVASLEGLPPIKVHCSHLAIDGLRKALHDYYRKAGVDRPDLLPKGEDDHHAAEGDSCQS